MVDKPLQLLGSALGPLALLLVGITLAYSKLGSMIRPAMRIAVVKTVVHPILFLGVAWLLGLRGIPMAAMALAAGLPVGANVYIFSQRYGVAQEEVTACIALSTGLSLFTTRLRKYAVSSMVSVPCVITMPSTSLPGSSSLMRLASFSMMSNDMSCER